MKKTDEEIVEIFRNTLSFAEQLGLSNSPNKANLLLLVKQSYRLAEAFMQSENELLQKENEELNRKLADREREIVLLKDEKLSDEKEIDELQTIIAYHDMQYAMKDDDIKSLQKENESLNAQLLIKTSAWQEEYDIVNSVWEALGKTDVQEKPIEVQVLELRKELEQAKEENKQHEEMIDQYFFDKESLTNRLVFELERLAKFEDENQSLRTQLNGLVEGLEKLKVYNESVRYKNSALAISSTDVCLQSDIQELIKTVKERTNEH